VNCEVNSRNVGIPRMDLYTEETRETLYIESTRGSLKNIIKNSSRIIYVVFNII